MVAEGDRVSDGGRAAAGSGEVAASHPHRRQCVALLPTPWCCAWWPPWRSSPLQGPLPKAGGQLRHAMQPHRCIDGGGDGYHGVAHARDTHGTPMPRGQPCGVVDRSQGRHHTGSHGLHTTVSVCVLGATACTRPMPWPTPEPAAAQHNQAQSENHSGHHRDTCLATCCSAWALRASASRCFEASAA